MKNNFLFVPLGVKFISNVSFLVSPLEVFPVINITSNSHSLGSIYLIQFSKRPKNTVTTVDQREGKLKKLKAPSQGQEAQLDNKLNSTGCIKTSIPEAK